MTRQQQRQVWWNHIQNALLAGLAVGILLVFWRMMHKTPLENLTPGVPVSELETPSARGRAPRMMEPATAPMAEAGRMRQMSPQPAVLSVEVFNQLVRENPDNMSQAIQTWLSEGRGTSGKN